jgi:hypothetical protein
MELPNPAPKQRPKCCIYIDGFNCYFRIFRHRPEWKWLNIQSFYENLRAREEVVCVKYFTAIIEPNVPFSEKKDRQALYFAALRAFSI